MRTLFLLIFCFHLNWSFAQNNFQVGYSEFPATILGHASDAQGNMYYTGNFKGALLVNGTTLAQGQGLEDIFWVKTSPSGQVIKYKTFSSPNSDFTLSDGLTMGSNNQLYCISWSLGDVRYSDSLTLAYQYPSGAKFMNTLCRIDTAGNVKWVRRTDINLLKVFSVQNLVHVIGKISRTSGPIRVEDSTILDTVGKPGSCIWFLILRVIF